VEVGVRVSECVCGCGLGEYRMHFVVEEVEMEGDQMRGAYG
jgi:hypothetical protein